MNPVIHLVGISKLEM